MKDKDKIYQNLIEIFKLFNNRPYHLVKYLTDNNAFDDSFIKKIINHKFENINVDIYFKDITQLNDYFNSLIDNPKKQKTKGEISIELNQKLDQLLIDEKYEEAIYVRDYMNKNNIRRLPG